jgi:hypothetical protein
MAETGRALAALCPEATWVSLNLPSALPFTQWQEIGQALAHVSGALAWWIGDWWAFGEHAYGERYKAAKEHLPLNVHSCENYASVARAFKETSRRREVLPFSHHQIVAALDPARADELLAWCAEPVATGGKPRSTRALLACLIPATAPQEHEQEHEHAQATPESAPGQATPSSEELTRLRSQDPAREWDVAEALKVWHEAASYEERGEFACGLSDTDLNTLIWTMCDQCGDYGVRLYQSGVFEDSRIVLLPEGVNKGELDQWLRNHCGKGLDE